MVRSSHYSLLRNINGETPLATGFLPRIPTIDPNPARRIILDAEEAKKSLQKQLNGGCQFIGAACLAGPAR